MSPTNGHAAQGPPVEWPTISIGGVEYLIRFGFGAYYRMEGYGIDVMRLKDAILTDLDSGRNVQLRFKLLAASIGTYEISMRGARWKQPEFTPLELADMFNDMHVSDFEELAKKLAASLRKALPAASGEPQAPAIVPPASQPEVSAVSSTG